MNIARLKGRFAPKARQVALEPPSSEQELLAAAMACDDAAAALGEALARRRRALVILASRTRLDGSATIKWAMSPSSAWKALWRHGAGEALQLPHSMARHRASFVEQAKATISNSASGRLPSPPPPYSATTEESHHEAQ
jgi:hypothetical protein